MEAPIPSENDPSEEADVNDLIVSKADPTGSQNMSHHLFSGQVKCMAITPVGKKHYRHVTDCARQVTRVHKLQRLE